MVGKKVEMRAKNEWGLGCPASPRSKPPLAFPTQMFSFSRLSGSLEQANEMAPDPPLF